MSQEERFYLTKKFLFLRTQFGDFFQFSGRNSDILTFSIGRNSNMSSFLIGRNSNIFFFTPMVFGRNSDPANSTFHNLFHNVYTICLFSYFLIFTLYGSFTVVIIFCLLCTCLFIIIFMNLNFNLSILFFTFSVFQFTMC